MSAQLCHLQEDLQQALEMGALSPLEAWAIQDQLLLSPEKFVVMPPELLPQLQKLLFSQVTPSNLLPL